MKSIVILHISGIDKDATEVFVYSDKKGGEKLAYKKFMELCAKNYPKATNDELKQMLKNGYQYFPITAMSVSFLHSKN